MTIDLDLTKHDTLTLAQLIDLVHVEWKAWAYKNWWRRDLPHGSGCDVDVVVTKDVYDKIPHIPGTSPLVLHGWLGTITVRPVT